MTKCPMDLPQQGPHQCRNAPATSTQQFKVNALFVSWQSLVQRSVLKQLCTSVSTISLLCTHLVKSTACVLSLGLPICCPGVEHKTSSSPPNTRTPAPAPTQVWPRECEKYTKCERSPRRIAFPSVLQGSTSGASVCICTFLGCWASSEDVVLVLMQTLLK